MLAFFRSNQVFVAFILAGYTLLVRSGIFWSVPAFSETGEMGFFTELVHLLIGDRPLVAAIVAMNLVLLQAILLNNIVNANKISAFNSFFPGLFFVFMASCIPDFLRLSAPMLATTFVLFAIDQLLKTWNAQKEASGRIFNVGFWIAIASLFYMPAIWLLFAAIAGLNLLRGFDLRERLMVFCGLLTPYLLAWTWFFWQDAGGWFWEKHFLSHQFGLVDFFGVPFSEKLAAKIALLAAAAFVVVLNHGSFYYKKIIQVQKYVGVLNWFLVVSAVIFLVRPHFELTHFYLCTPFLGLFTGIVFLNIKNQPIAEVLHLLMLFMLVFLAIWA